MDAMLHDIEDLGIANNALESFFFLSFEQLFGRFWPFFMLRRTINFYASCIQGIFS